MFGLVLHLGVHLVQLLFGQHWIFIGGIVLVWFGIPPGLLGFWFGFSFVSVNFVLDNERSIKLLFYAKIRVQG